MMRALLAYMVGTNQTFNGTGWIAGGHIPGALGMR